MSDRRARRRWRWRRRSARRSDFGAAAAAAVALLSSTAAVAAGRCPDLAGREDAVVRGEVLITLTEFPGSDAKEGCVVGYIPASPDAVMTILRDAASYDEYMPRVERSDVSTGSDGALLNRQELDLPFPIGDRQFTIVLTEQRSDDGAYRLGFTYVEGSGNIKDTRGHWLIEPWRDGSRVTYVLWTDPGGAIPKWAVNRASRRTLPDVVAALRERVLERRPGAGSSAGHEPSS
jgi:hypothetical protein